MKLILHTPEGDSELSSYYRQALANAVELFIVTAYLTEWNASLKLNSDCQRFRVIIGKDFGITRKTACQKLMRWLPPNRKGQFMVADGIRGFHPKAVFWKESSGKAFAIVGSSNLTSAAFETNHEANVYCQLSKADYAQGKQWVKRIEKQSVVVSEDWLKKYKEAPLKGGRRAGGKRKVEQDDTPLSAFELPMPRGMQKHIKNRRDQLVAYEKNRGNLIRLFRDCANKKISSKQFYERLPKFWSAEVGDRLQGRGWERTGQSSDFQLLSKSFVKILKSNDEDRDDIVKEEIDWLKDKEVSTRNAFLSEMLCLSFPKEYPVLAYPIRKYMKDIKFKPPRGASEGVCFIYLAKRLRFSLLQNPNHPAKNLAELDTVIWLKYGKKRFE